MRFSRFTLTLLIISFSAIKAQNNETPPIEKIILVTDHIIESNPFHYVLKPTEKKETLADLNYIDFGRTFGNHNSAVAYGLSWLNSPVEQKIRLKPETP